MMESEIYKITVIQRLVKVAIYLFRNIFFFASVWDGDSWSLGCRRWVLRMKISSVSQEKVSVKILNSLCFSETEVS